LQAKPAEYPASFSVRKFSRVREAGQPRAVAAQRQSHQACKPRTIGRAVAAARQEISHQAKGRTGERHKAYVPFPVGAMRRDIENASSL
jgi:hypothetical protein